MTAHILYQVDGFEEWEINVDTFRRLDPGSQLEILGALRKMYDQLVDEYHEEDERMATDLETAIMNFLEGDDEPILSKLIPAVVESTGEPVINIKKEICRLNGEHRFSISIDEDLEVHFYIPWMVKCRRCGSIQDATDHNTPTGTIVYVGNTLNKIWLCHECLAEIAYDWAAAGMPNVKTLMMEDERIWHVHSFDYSCPLSIKTIFHITFQTQLFFKMKSE